MKCVKYKIDGGLLVNCQTGAAIPDDEPVFVFRAKDQRSIATLLFYQTICERLDQTRGVGCRIDDFREFRRRHPERMAEPTP